MLSFTTILQSIVIGLSIAVIPGPIFFELTRRTLTGGFWSGALVSVGEFIGNILLLYVIFFGASYFLVYPIVKIILYTCGSLILMYLGLLAFKIKSEEIESSYNATTKSSGSIISGFLIAVTSPIVITFWISLSGSYLAEFSSLASSVLAIFFIVLGFVMFFFCLAAIINVTRKKIPARYVVLLSHTFGTILYLYALFFVYKLIMLILI